MHRAETTQEEVIKFLKQTKKNLYESRGLYDVWDVHDSIEAFLKRLEHEQTES